MAILPSFEKKDGSWSDLVKPENVDYLKELMTSDATVKMVAPTLGKYAELSTMIGAGVSGEFTVSNTGTEKKTVSYDSEDFDTQSNTNWKKDEQYIEVFARGKERLGCQVNTLIWIRRHFPALQGVAITRTHEIRGMVQSVSTAHLEEVLFKAGYHQESFVGRHANWQRHIANEVSVWNGARADKFKAFLTKSEADRIAAASDPVDNLPDDFDLGETIDSDPRFGVW